MSSLTYDDLNLCGVPRHDIAELSRYFGQFSIESHGYQNIFLGGGNSSINNGNTLWVKLSGTSFKNIGPEDFGELNLERLQDGLPKVNSLCKKVLSEDYRNNFTPVVYLDELASSLFTEANMGSGEPSVETGLHARLAGSEEIPRWNIHDHNTIINSMLCAENAEEAFYDIFGRDNRMIRYMEFIEPGAPLFVVFNDKMKKWEKEDIVKVILLSQHGKILSGESAKEVIGLHNNAIEKVNNYIKDNIPKDIFHSNTEPVLDTSCMESAVRYIEEYLPDFYVNNVNCEDMLIKYMLCSEYALSTLAKGMPNPDAVVYGNAAVMNIDFNWEKSNLKDKIAEAIHYYKNTHGALNLNKDQYLPKIIIIPKAGVITVGANRKVAENAYAALLDTVYIMRGAEAFGGMKPLSPKHQYYINNWAAEKRRAAKAS